MKVYTDTTTIPIKSWCDNIEIGALEQAINIANLPFAFKHIAVMGDGHLGYGMPIGGVLATNNVIIPNCVGLDISCGMRAVKTSLTEINKEDIKKVLGRIRQVIPVGFKHHDKRQMEIVDLFGMEESNLRMQKYIVVTQEAGDALKQVGTLGGGNHFWELQKGNDGNIWIMIHSGSRNIGKKVAEYYNALAIKLNEQWFSSVPKKQQLAFLPIETTEAKMYMLEMQACMRFAEKNRALMMQRSMEVLNEFVSATSVIEYDVTHNYARWENHFGKNVIIHRKGAISAREGEIGIIPGSMGSASYITTGKGNVESFTSSSHGAGRQMGRKEAVRSLNLNEEIAKLNNAGIVHGLRNQSDLEEATSAYKDINIVMQAQTDLVNIIVELKPLAGIKG